MASTNSNNARQTHVSPGIYTREIDLNYASKSLGITKLGVVGETVKGPAFQPILIENWREYQTYFGSTNTDKFSGSNYPKYELPYIAKSFLQQSDQLQVVRVLGLSGVNAGPAWVIKAVGTGDGENMVVAVLRSRGEHRKATFISEADPENGICEDQYEYDKILYYAKDVKLVPSSSLNLGSDCEPGYTKEEGDFSCDATNYGTFTIRVTTYEDEIKNYPVSLNSDNREYIYNVIGGDPEVGEPEVYVEELYDVALKQLIENGDITAINEELQYFPGIRIVPSHESVTDLLTEDESMLTKRYVGNRYLYSAEYSKDDAGEPYTVHISDDKGKTWLEVEGVAGHIYTVVSYVTSDGSKAYYYGEYVCSITSSDSESDNDCDSDADTFTVTSRTTTYTCVAAVADSSSTTSNYVTEYISATNTDSSSTNDGDNSSSTITNEEIYTEAVQVESDGLYYVMVESDDSSNSSSSDSTSYDVAPLLLDMNDYREQYRYASTPWILSEMRGSAEHVKLTKLFRFHTISDGNSSNTEIKISIKNIDPEEGTFDVLIRDFYDTDASQTVLERFTKCDLIPGSDNYIGYKIGTLNGDYETVSDYVTVEINETDLTQASVPAGFMGYPVRNYSGIFIGEGGVVSKITDLNAPYLQYNTTIDEDVRINKQYFGLSDLQGIDEDVLSYKGLQAYNGEVESITPCFHLDARIINGTPREDGYVYQDEDCSSDSSDSSDDCVKQQVEIDGVSGYSWSTVSKVETVNNYDKEPRLGTEDDMEDTIYEDKRYRKFTVAFYGGWNGWDYYRKYRSNGDDFRYQTYRGTIDTESGKGTNFSVIEKPEMYGFDSADKCINSDYYAYLYGIRQFANPSTIDINVLATPGIDYVNNNSLVGETIEMVEEERADSVYVVTTPDKPLGATDDEGEMYTPDDVIWNLEDSEIDSNYTCTYYPNVKYYDTDNNQYIYLPATKDVVRNFAYTDNVKYPWFASAGWTRGTIEGIKSKKTLKLAEEDTLYEGRVNFVKNFATDGMRIWGDKNLQVAESQMNRISKRRLLLRIRKLCSIACIGLIFEPNDNTTKHQFESAITPIMDDILANRGITDWRLEIDDSDEARERLELPAKLYIKPQPNLEYIDLSFIITPQGTDWGD